MPTVATYNQSGVKVGEIQLNDAVFGVEVNEAVMHQAVVDFPTLGSPTIPHFRDITRKVISEQE